MGATNARADTAILTALKDTTLYEPLESAPSEYPGNGAGDYFFAGTTKDGIIRRGLIAFEIAGPIPEGATITSVELRLNVSRVAGQGPPVSHDTSLHRVLLDWGEGASDADAQEGRGDYPPAENDATWDHRFYNDTFWTTDGGDYDLTASATIPVGAQGEYTWGSTSGMVADVQQWLDNPGSNAGWIIIGNEATERTARRFDSSQNSANVDPELTVEYSVAGPVGSCCNEESCQVTTEGMCLAMGGSYGGDGTSCSPNPCVDPFGACCADDGTCSETTQSDCEGAVIGTFQGEGSMCAEIMCPINLTPWLDSLPLPAVATPTSGSAGSAATYDMTIRETSQQLHSELPPTVVWGYDDGTGTTFPGPTIEASTGNQVDVNWINDLRVDGGTGGLRADHYLDVDTACVHGAVDLPKAVVHLHGGHVEARYDGYPESTFLPGEMEHYVYPNVQQAGNIWYHDHALGITRLNVYMGLAGFYLIRDAVEGGLNLPSGGFEIPLALQDRQFNPDGTLYYPSVWTDHFVGDKAVVNGKVWPYLNVTTGKYRFRLLNGSSSRTYTLSLDPPEGNMDFTVIGNDGGLLNAPVPSVSELTMGPGERFDVVVDFAGLSPGDEVLLENSAPNNFPNGFVDLTELVKFNVVSGAAHTDPLPGSLATVTPIDPNDAVMERDFLLRKANDDGCGRQNWLINGLGWDDITEYPELGTVEIWRFINDSGVSHPMHMHLVFFQILDRQQFTLGAEDEVVSVGDPTPPAAWEAGWKDTAMVGPGEMMRVIARFEDYPGKYAYHCHILEHEDHEMMRQFQTVVPGCNITGEEGEFCDGIDNDCDGVVDTPGCTSLEIVKEISVDGGSTWHDANDAATAPVVDYPSGAEYRITVSNLGPSDLVNVVVNDSTLGVVNHVIGDLNAGADVMLTSSEIAELGVGQVCNSADTIGNTATANGKAAVSGAAAPQASDPANLVCVTPPAIDVLKEISVDGGATWDDANDVGSAPVVDFPHGAEYRITVSNPGPTDLVNVVVNDPTLGIVNHAVGGLAAGVDEVLTSTEIEALGKAQVCGTEGTYVNTATADGDSAKTGTSAPQDADPANLVCVAPPAISVLKEISVDGGNTWHDADDVGSAPVVQPPSGAEYRITVSNPGVTDLVNVVVNDATLALSDYAVGALAAGLDEVFTSTEISALSKALVCDADDSFSNTATADGDSADSGTAAPQAADSAVLVCATDPLQFYNGFENPKLLTR